MVAACKVLAVSDFLNVHESTLLPAIASNIFLQTPKASCTFTLGAAVSPVTMFFSNVVS